MYVFMHPLASMCMHVVAFKQLQQNCTAYSCQHCLQLHISEQTSNANADMRTEHLTKTVIVVSNCLVAWHNAPDYILSVTRTATFPAPYPFTAMCFISKCQHHVGLSGVCHSSYNTCMHSSTCPGMDQSYAQLSRNSNQVGNVWRVCASATVLHLIRRDGCSIWQILSAAVCC
jgi:hypothetical protein